MKTLLCLALVLATQAATAKDRLFEVTPRPGQEAMIVQGQQFVVARTATVAVALTVAPESSSRAWIEIDVRNNSEAPVTFLDTSVAISNRGKSLRVFRFVDLEKQMKRKQAWAAIGAGLAAAGNGYSAGTAGYSYQSGTYTSRTTANAYGSNGYSYGTANTTGTYSGMTYDPAVAQAAQAQANATNQAMFNDLSKRNAADKNSLVQRVLRSNTVTPQAMIGGQLMIELPKKSKNASPSILVLKVGEQVFEFDLIER